MVTIRLRTFIVALLVLWCSHAWAAVELDSNHDGKIDDTYIPSTITRDSELSAGLAGKANISCFADALALVACFPSLTIGGGISHATSDGSYYGSRNGAWVNLSGAFAAPLGPDDNYVTDAEKTKLGNLSGTNTGDQDLSGYALTSEVLLKTNTTPFTPSGDHQPATKKYVDDSITASGGYTDEQAQDAAGAMVSGNTETGITVSYDDATGKLNFSVATQSDVNFTVAKDTKLAGIATGAEVNVNADWNSVSGDSQILNKPTIPSTLAALSADSTHRLVSDAEKSTWNAKQDTLVSGTNLKSVNGVSLLGYGDLPITGSPAWMPSTGPTNGRQILQAVGGCSNTAYDTQVTCETNGGTWATPTYQHTSVISGLINDSGTADDDLLSAAKTLELLAGKQAALVSKTNLKSLTINGTEVSLLGSGTVSLSTETGGASTGSGNVIIDCGNSSSTTCTASYDGGNSAN